MIPSELYLEHAKKLSPGTTKKIPHEGCSSSAAMMISNTARGYGATCFKCGQKGFTPHGYLTLSEILSYQKAADKELQKQNGQKSITLPKDFSQDIPKAGLIWLWKYGITDDEIATFGIGWSENLKRVILPVYNNGKLVYWQGRAVLKDQKPKYLNIGESNEIYFLARKQVYRGVQNYNITNCYTESKTLESSRRVQEDIQETAGYSSGVRARGHLQEMGHRGDHNPKLANVLCITEDILSAIKVGRVTDCVSFLGTGLHRESYKILREYDYSTLWYDNDRAGRKASEAFEKKYGTLIKSRRIYTPRDPKAYSTRRIKELLRLHS